MSEEKKSEEALDKIEEAILEELREENELIEHMEDRVKAEKRKFYTKIAVAVTLLVALVAGGYYFITSQTYRDTTLLATRKVVDVEKGKYAEFAGGILKYSRDGVSLLDKKGKERWNQPYQMKNPVVTVSEHTAAIFDKGGNEIAVFKKTGLKGEIHTTLPIAKVVVSGQGIVGTVLKNDHASEVVCYDAAGNVLVEQQASSADFGEPLDIALSPNGYLLNVSYLSMEGGALTSRVICYNFSEEGKKAESNKVTEDVYENEVFPSIFFLDDHTSVAVGDSSFVLYDGKDAPKQKAVVKFTKDIKSAFHNEDYLGFVLKNKSGKAYEICLYNKSGKQLMSTDYEGEYGDIKLAGDEIVLYSGNVCDIYSKTGVHKFQGEFDTNIIAIFPQMGINKYLLINANGIEEVRLAK